MAEDEPEGQERFPKKGHGKKQKKSEAKKAKETEKEKRQEVGIYRKCNNFVSGFESCFDFRESEPFFWGGGKRLLVGSDAAGMMGCTARRYRCENNYCADAAFSCSISAPPRVTEWRGGTRGEIVPVLLLLNLVIVGAISNTDYGDKKVSLKMLRLCDASPD